VTNFGRKRVTDISIINIRQLKDGNTQASPTFFFSPRALS
jgi:hypothetical protein